MEEKSILTVPSRQELLAEMEKESGEPISRCFQCGKCVSACPVGAFMDFPPRELLNLILLGDRETVLSSNTPWVCTACYSCSAVCPNQIELVKVMDALKQKAVKENYEIKYPQILAFHREFLKQVRKNGRVQELNLAGSLQLKSPDKMKDWKLGMEMLAKGRLKPGFTPGGGKKIVRLIFGEEKS